MFLQVKGFEGYYEVNENGVVRSVDRLIWNGKKYFLKKGQIIKQQTNKKGYKICYLSKGAKNKTCLVHRLVALAFIQNPKKLEQVNHIDCNKQNNNVNNLEWCSNLENQRHARKNGLVWRWENSGRKKRKVIKVDRFTNEMLSKYDSIAEAARINNLNRANIKSVCDGKRKTCGNYIWKFYEEKEVIKNGEL